MPDMDGLEVCRRLRRQNPDVRILLLTAKGQESDKVLGLELGADDYVSKPFGLPRAPGPGQGTVTSGGGFRTHGIVSLRGGRGRSRAARGRSFGRSR